MTTETKAMHTPGPWEQSALGTSNTLIWRMGHGEIATAFYDPASRLISKEQSEANARLITGAPEMLEVLEAILEFWNEGHEGQPLKPDDLLIDAQDGEAVYARAYIEAAIRKAKGEL